MAEKVDQMNPDEKIVEIAIERLRVFENHPFRVEMDSQMKDLQDSIKKYGIITPVIVRPRKEGYYEIISGHRRIFAAEKLGYRKVPTIIRYMTDDQAVIAMVDSNLQTDINSSVTTTAMIVKEYGQDILYYTYMTNPSAATQSDNPIQHGTCRMVLCEDNTRLIGKYWTSSNTTGDIEWDANEMEG